MSLIRTFQEHAQEAADAAHGAADAAHEAGAETVDLGGMIIHHLVDTREWVGLTESQVWHLPTFEPIHLGPLTLDLSPTKHVLLLFIAAALVSLVMIGTARALRRREDGRAPSGFANAMEAMILFFRDTVVRPNIGHGADGFAPFILTLFFFILTLNVLGLVPLMGSATGNLSVTAALALITFVVVEITGMRTLGMAGYARTIFYAPPGMSGPMKFLMLAIMTPVEFIGKLTKPFALAIRLFANMTAGHTLILTLIGIIFLFGQIAFGRWAVATGSIVFATAVMCLELFVAFLQAYIFALLSAVFIGLIRHAH